MQKYWNTVTDRSGKAIQGASIAVTTYPAGAAATLYSDDGVTPTANPVTTDASGYFEFYAADGRYTLSVSGAGINPYTLHDVMLDDPSDDKSDIGLGNVDNTSDADKPVSTSVRAELDIRLPEIGTYALLEAYTGPVTAFHVVCREQIFDGAHGVFRVVEGDTTTPADGGVWLVDALGRRWRREFSGWVNVLWFGTDRAAIQAAIDTDENVFAPAKTYVLDGTLYFRNRHFVGEIDANTSTTEFNTLSGDFAAFAWKPGYIREGGSLKNFRITINTEKEAAPSANKIGISIQDQDPVAYPQGFEISNVTIIGGHTGYDDRTGAWRIKLSNVTVGKAYVGFNKETGTMMEWDSCYTFNTDIPWNVVNSYGPKLKNCAADAQTRTSVLQNCPGASIDGMHHEAMAISDRFAWTIDGCLGFEVARLSGVNNAATSVSAETGIINITGASRGLFECLDLSGFARSGSNTNTGVKVAATARVTFIEPIIPAATGGTSVPINALQGATAIVMGGTVAAGSTKYASNVLRKHEGQAAFAGGTLGTGTVWGFSGISVPGAEVGDFAIGSASFDLQGVTISAHVESAGLVEVMLHNGKPGSVTLAAGAIFTAVIKRGGL